MSSNRFIDRLAALILEDYVSKNAAVTVVLPNRRARVFLLEALKSQTQVPFFAPRIISIEELIQEISGLHAIDQVELLFEFYEVYLSVTEAISQQPFEQFANWAGTLLRDFNEIDRYLLEPHKILRYLDDINQIAHWSVEAEKSSMIENYLNFWKLLPVYYDALYAHLHAKGVGYQGMVYREAVAHLSGFLASQKHQMIFAGFNALNAAEEQLFKTLLAHNQARVLWDADAAFLEDPYHDAGYFLRRYKAQWSHYKTHPFEWIVNDFAKPKNIQVIATPKLIGQAKIAGELIAQLDLAQNENGQRTAIVLADENLLLPVLRALPENAGSLNITMGYSARNNPVQLLLNKLFKLHTGALKRNPKSYVFYYRDLIEVLAHPLVMPIAQTQSLVQHIQTHNYTFITQARFEELHAGNPYFKLLFNPWSDGPLAVLERLSAILLEIKQALQQATDTDKVSGAFVFALYQVINKLSSYYQNQSHTQDLQTLYSIYKQVVELAEVSFEGEPLDGLQLMGVLESRVLDFDTVVITSVNEGKFPAGKSQNSFIPYDVKREYGLPTFKEKDAIYTYHFYHLLQRAQNVYLLYNMESEGLEAGERSRFITQLEVEKQPAHDLQFETRQPETPPVSGALMRVEKSGSVMERLAEIAREGFSPSALTSYIRNPIDFYFRKILRIREADEVEENIALNTLGTIIHGTLEQLYQPLLNRILRAEDIQDCFKKVDAQVRQQFREVYKEGEISRGRNLLAFEVAKRNVVNFLNQELESLKSGAEIIVKHLEARFERELLHDALPYPVKIGGSVDRIELRDGRIRITDYKTGRVDQRSLQLTTWDGLVTEVKHDKIIQLLCYAFLFESQAQGREMEVGIISFKNLKAGFMPLLFKNPDKTVQSTVNADMIASFREQAVQLLLEILNPEMAFEEKQV